MKRTLAVAMILLSTPLLGVAAAYGNEDKTKRQDCNKLAQGLTGNERTRIINNCTHRNAAASPMSPVLARITNCNQKAGEMKGDLRVKFVDQCMQEP